MDPVVKNVPTRVDRAVTAVVFLAFVGWAGVLAARARGVMEADEVLHWLYARHAPANPWNFLHVWARPVCTALIWPVSGLGLDAARWISVLAAGLAALAAWRAASTCGFPHAPCAIPLTFAQPLFFQQTFGVWTEVVFSAFAGAWVLAAVCRRPVLMALIAAATPLVRPEGFFLVVLTMGMAAVGWVRDRNGHVARRSVLILAPSLIAAWAIAGWIGSGDPLWLVHAWPPNWAPDQAYGRGDVSWLWQSLVQVLPVFSLPLCAIGLVLSIRQRTWPAGALLVVILGLHTTLWVLGRFGTAGYARYFVTLAPAFALLACGGLDVLLRVWRSSSRAIVTTVVAVAAAVGLLRHPTAVDPPTMPPDGRLLAAVGRWIESREPGALVYSAHPFTYLELPRIPSDRFADFGNLKRPVLESVPPGSWLVVEDRFYRPIANGPEIDAPTMNPPERELPGLGFVRVEVPDLGVDMRVTDPRQDPALEHMHLAVYRRAK